MRLIGTDTCNVSAAAEVPSDGALSVLAGGDMTLPRVSDDASGA